LEKLNFDPVFITFLLGLIEDRHPYRSLVEIGLQQLIDSPYAREKIIVLMPQAILPLRQGLSNKNKDIFLGALKVFERLAM
jgi:hypothetical protein